MANPIKLMFLGLLVMPFFGQEAQAAVYRYLVPLPGTKNIAISEWEFTLEFSSLTGKEYMVAIEQYDIRGRLIDQAAFGLRNGPEVFRWNITENAVNSRLRSVVIVSDQPLMGSIWMWSAEYGQINGMQLAKEMSPTLVMPFIPESYFQMTTSFALQGFSLLGQSSEVSFFLIDEDQKARDPLTLRSNLTSNGYIIGTPELTLSLGSLDGEVVPSWASIKPLSASFFMSGFQTFTREDSSKAFLFQSAGSQLNEKGYPEGHILFSPIRELPLRHEIVLTNPNEFPIGVNLEVFYKGFEPLLDQKMLQSSLKILTLDPFERRRYILGEDIFSNVKASFFRMQYSAVTLAEEPVPAELFALHFQMGPQGEMSGANFAQPGNEIRTWLTRSEDYETTVELVSVGRQSLLFPDVEIVEGVEVPSGDPSLISEDSFIEVRFLTEDGRIHFVPLQFEAGEYFPVLSIDKISSFFGEESLDAVQVTFQVTSGQPAVAKMTRRGINDFAVVNPYTVFVTIDDKGQ